MKNPFVKEDHSGVTIAAVAVGAITAGAIAYLYATKKGFAFRKKLSGKSKEVKEHATDYLQHKAPKLKKKVTDLHDIEVIVKS
ncbi:YtxH domain-containing protein [Mucilaginibacter terrae]|uniref:YtxH domain-containing protein n=1 Tax=Mucilaginibacter terrae TaxID=1955052 RepID=UPI0036366059